jgi:hypothetical protein
VAVLKIRDVRLIVQDDAEPSCLHRRRKAFAWRALPWPHRGGHCASTIPDNECSIADTAGFGGATPAQPSRCVRGRCRVAGLFFAMPELVMREAVASES